MMSLINTHTVLTGMGKTKLTLLQLEQLHSLVQMEAGRAVRRWREWAIDKGENGWRHLRGRWIR